MHRIFIVIFLYPLFVQAGQGHLNDTLKKNVWGVSLQGGNVVIHKPAVQNSASMPKSASVEFSTHRIDYSSYKICRTYIRTGFSFTYIDFESKITGKGIAFSRFVEPVYRIGNSFQFQFRGTVGLGYFTKPYHKTNNPENQSYSTNLSPVLQLSSGFGFRLGNKITMQLNGQFNHISNGHFKQPNLGLNWLMLSGTVLYYSHGNKLPKYKYHRTKPNTKTEYSIGGMFVPGQGYHAQRHSRRQFMIGLYAKVLKPLTRINGITGGFETDFNKFKDDDMAPKGNSKPAWLASVHAGHVFLIGKVIFSQQIGRYLTKYPSFFSAYYHRWGIIYKVNRKWSLGCSLKAHREIADLIDFRVEFRL